MTMAESNDPVRPPQQPRPRVAPPALPTDMRGRFLRIRLIVGRQMLDERIIRDREPITIGESPEATFTVNPGWLEGIRLERHALFTFINGRYVLDVTSEMDGKVTTFQGDHTLEEMRQIGHARRTKTGWRLDLDSRSTGKIEVGTMIVLFQFVGVASSGGDRLPHGRTLIERLRAAWRAFWMD